MPPWPPTDSSPAVAEDSIDNTRWQLSHVIVVLVDVGVHIGIAESANESPTSDEVSLEALALFAEWHCRHVVSSFGPPPVHPIMLSPSLFGAWCGEWHDVHDVDVRSFFATWMSGPLNAARGFASASTELKLTVAEASTAYTL
jgi:hypothetical protein